MRKFYILSEYVWVSKKIVYRWLVYNVQSVRRPMNQCRDLFYLFLETGVSNVDPLLPTSPVSVIVVYIIRSFRVSGVFYSRHPFYGLISPTLTTPSKLKFVTNPVRSNFSTVKSILHFLDVWHIRLHTCTDFRSSTSTKDKNRLDLPRDLQEKLSDYNVLSFLQEVTFIVSGKTRFDFNFCK